MPPPGTAIDWPIRPPVPARRRQLPSTRRGAMIQSPGVDTPVAARRPRRPEQNNGGSPEGA